MDYTAPTRPIPTTSSLFNVSPTTAKPPTAANPNNVLHPLQVQSQASASTSASTSTSLKRTSTEVSEGLGASSNMASLRSRSSKVAKNSQNGSDSPSISGQLQNGEPKATSPPAPLFDPRDDQIKDLQTDLAKLQKCVTCVVCQDLLFEPYSLGCGHVFCYTCLKDWFRQKKTCPECRARVKHQPAPAYLIRGMIDTFVARAELLAPHDEGLNLRQQQVEALKIIETDRADTKGIFSGMFVRKSDARPIYDPADDVARCPDCNWEIEGRTCASCGRRFHASEMPGADSEASESDFSDEEESELDDDDDESISGSDNSDHRPDYMEDEYPESESGFWDHDYDEDQDHRLALALQDEYHQEFMRQLGVDANYFDEQFGPDRALAAREAARDYLQRSMSRGLSSPGRSLQPSSPYSRDSEDDSDEHTIDEDDSDMEDFIVHDTPDRRLQRQQPAARTLRRNNRRSVADLSDDDDDEDDDDDDDEPVVGLRRNRPNRYYNRNTIVVSSDNEDDEEATGLINDGYAQLDHDTTTGDDDDDYDSMDDGHIGPILRPAGPLRANTMPTTTSIGARRTLREQAAADRRSATPPATRRRRRTVTFQVPDDADVENDSDTRDGDGDLDMDRHSRAGSTSLASITSNRTDTSIRARSGGNHFSQDTPSVNEDESSDDSLPRQHRRRRVGNTTSSSNLRRAATAHPAGGARNRLTRTVNSVDPVVHRLLRTFNAQRNESQLETLGMSILENAVSATPGPRSASHDLQELNEPIVISSSPGTALFQRDNSSRHTPVLQATSRESSYPLSTSGQTSREASVLSTESTPRPSGASPNGNITTATISNVISEPTAWEIANAGSVSSGSATVTSTQNGAMNRGGMRTRRSNAALRGQDIQRTGTPSGRTVPRGSRGAARTAAESEEIRRRAQDFLAGRRDLAAANPSQSASTNARATRSTSQAATSAMSLQQRISNRAEALSRSRDSATPTPATQNQQQADAESTPPRGLSRTDTAGSGRRRGFQIGTGNNPGPLFVISDDDAH